MNGSINKGNFDFPLDHQTLFLTEDGEWDRMQFLDGIKVLLSFSLISILNHFYSMHILVNTWSRSCIPEGEIGDHYHKARALLSCSVIPDWGIDNYAFCKLLAPHIRSNLLHGKEFGLEHKYYGHEFSAFAIVFAHSGNWDEEEKFLDAAIDSMKAMLGEDHPKTLTAMHNLAVTYKNQGRWDEAEKLLVEVMNASKVKLGSDHPTTLTAMHNLALIYMYGQQGRLDEAEKLQVEVMKASKLKL